MMLLLNGISNNQMRKFQAHILNIFQKLHECLNFQIYKVAMNEQDTKEQYRITNENKFKLKPNLYLLINVDGH